MNTHDQVPFGFSGKPTLAETARIPMVVVPAELLNDVIRDLKYGVALCRDDSAALRIMETIGTVHQYLATV